MTQNVIQFYKKQSQLLEVLGKIGLIFNTFQKSFLCFYTGPVDNVNKVKIYNYFSL